MHTEVPGRGSSAGAQSIGVSVHRWFLSAITKERQSFHPLAIRDLRHTLTCTHQSREALSSLSSEHKFCGLSPVFGY